MPTARSRPAVDGLRRALAHLASRHARWRHLMAVSGRELTRAAEVGGTEADRHAAEVAATYGASYFGEGRDPGGDRAGLSGYARYDRVASNADIAGWTLWRNFRAESSLDVGCATGFLVEVLRERGVEAEGCDVSEFAVSHASPGAAGHLRVANLFAGLPWPEGTFPLVTALEILEHLPPGRVPDALAELHRVCGGYLYATIPSFGPNRSGVGGHFEGKVRPERVEYYRHLGPDYPGPVPEADLAVDAEGHLVEGHLTIASFEWWTEQFAQVGFTRCPDVERRIYADVEPAGLAPFWNVYVLRVDGAPDELAQPRCGDRTLVELGLRHPLYDT
jgi:SAM-dependent methyltransferase